MGDVWIVGSINVDLITRVHRLPSPGETVAGGDLERRPGGKGANQAVAAAAAGAKVHMVGRVGDDPAGAAYIAGLQNRSVDTSGIAVEPNCATGHAIVLVDDEAENCIVVIPGANGRVGPEDVARFQPARDDILLLQLELPTDVIAEAIMVATRAGARTVLNLAPYHDLAAELVGACDIVVVNEHEARQLAASGVAPGSLVVTRGAKGASWGDRTAAHAAEAVVDTTGAGDAFAGAFAAALAAGADDQTALDNAAAAGAAAVGWPGAQGWQF